MLPVIATGGVVVLAVLTNGCAHGPRPAAHGSASIATESRTLPPQRSLFRVRYRGAEGAGSLRLALYRVAANAYQLRATDTFGRAVWSLSVRDGLSQLLDYRSRRYCETQDEVRIPEVALAPLPLERLPDVLAGGLPALPAEGERPGSGEFLDRRGRRWTIRIDGDGDGGVLVAWTLWESGTPALWWSRLEKGGVLSHRQGSQFRWRLSVTEPMEGPLEPLEPPADFLSVDCARLGGSG